MESERSSEEGIDRNRKRAINDWPKIDWPLVGGFVNISGGVAL